MIVHQEVIEYSSATRMAEVYQRTTAKIVELANQMKAECQELHDLFVSNGAYSYDFKLDLRYHSQNYEHDDILEIIKRMKRDAWECLIRKLDVRKIMSKNKQDMLDAQLEGKSEYYDRTQGLSVPLGELPEITADNIVQVLTGLIESSGSMIEEKIREEYDFWKTHRSDGYKTNDPNILGEKVIRGWLVRREGWRTEYWNVVYQNEAHLQSLDHIFHLLDGKGIPQEYGGQLVAAIKACGDDGAGETQYFKFKCFRNGNLHLRFKNLELLAEFNRIAAGMNIGTAREKSRGTTAV